MFKQAERKDVKIYPYLYGQDYLTDILHFAVDRKHQVINTSSETIIWYRIFSKAGKWEKGFRGKYIVDSYTWLDVYAKKRQFKGIRDRVFILEPSLKQLLLIGS